MEKPVFPEEEKPEKDEIVMVVEVKLTKKGEVLLSSSSDNDMLIIKLLLDAAKGNVDGMLKRSNRTVQAMRLVSPINGGVRMPR